MKTVGIAIDRYKLPVFARHLTEAGYAFEQSPGLNPDMLFLRVKTETIAALQPVVEAAQRECAK